MNMRVNSPWQDWEQKMQRTDCWKTVQQVKTPHSRKVLLTEAPRTSLFRPPPAFPKEGGGGGGEYLWFKEEETLQISFSTDPNRQTSTGRDKSSRTHSRSRRDGGGVERAEGGGGRKPYGKLAVSTDTPLLPPPPPPSSPTRQLLLLSRDIYKRRRTTTKRRRRRFRKKEKPNTYTKTPYFRLHSPLLTAQCW